ncbi:hypothetical protein I316_00173 [Kwoniella heveanensis BCC8398]|uniref:Uncharacterized protein n=1 Tax=Kwoniella heveanensis BCC8398 TaxID=1296120 RepID=A0A1B9H3W1_9TREE|nr:hypothetical protein I316_00173 [Kwoniella heveanensis BCC8398]
MPATSFMLVREGQTDLAPFSPPDLSLAHTQWLLELSARLDRLNSARDLSVDLDYSGTCMDSDLVAPLEEAVDEARRMVCALGGEMRRRSEGSLPPWMGNNVNIYGGAGVQAAASAGSSQAHSPKEGSNASESEKDIKGGIMTRAASSRT